MILRMLTAIVIFGIVAGCQGAPTEFERVENKIEEFNPELLQATSIIIIPREGCGGCIRNATWFVVHKIDSIDSKIIFTGVNDKKLLRIQLGEELLARKGKVFVDHGNILMASSLTSIYPVMIKLQHSKILSIENFEPAI